MTRFHSEWLTFRPRETPRTHDKATDRTDRSPLPGEATAFRQFCQSTISASAGKTPSMTLTSVSGFARRAAPEPTDKTDKSPSVSFVSSLLARFRENGRPEALLAAATRLLSYYQRQAPTVAEWLQHFEDALTAARATFPPERRHVALCHYRRRYVEGRPPAEIAAHTVALQLWAADGRQHGNGWFLEAAFSAAGLELDPSPPPGAPV